MTTKTKNEGPTLSEALDECPRVAAAISRETAQYLGPCIVQAPGAWSRIGPTWFVPSVGWITYGPGLKTWGTSQGLAELAVSQAPKPELHAVGLSVCPEPNIVFAVTSTALGSSALTVVAALAAEADDRERGR